MTNYKRILASIMTIGVTCLLLGGATIAYFSDTEKSPENTFSSGKLDLKVDSIAHYNGMICLEGEWVLPENFDAETAPPETEISFDCEVEEGINRECTENGFDYSIAKWEWEGNGDGSYQYEGHCPNGTSVTGTAQEANWTAADPLAAGIIRKAGKNSVIYYLNGETSGIVFANGKDVSHLTFCGDNEPWCGNGIKEPGEECDGEDSANMGEICTPNCRLVDKECETTWDLRDITTEKFFNFTSLSPGDYGENTISLHVYDNDAWSRFLIENVIDQETPGDNQCTNSEKEAENSNCGTNGELRENLYFWIWLDQGKKPGFQGKENDREEGDNLWQSQTEPELAPRQIISENGEVWNIWDWLKTAWIFNGGTDATGIVKDGRLINCVTYYLGIGWELPQDAGDEAQTDTFSADVKIDTVQYRNNPNHNF
jgi:predicted ribosomally synthesized peptide with SipW-like signal peptide